jgi:hypothetical protein
MRKSIDELLKNPKKSVIKAINDLDVLIVEVSISHSPTPEPELGTPMFTTKFTGDLNG